MTHPPLVEALLLPEAYPERERPAKVELRQTHISWLFFTGDFVYKVKKPVDFGFLDFTTLERRLFYCHEEVRLNRRLSPDVYLGVVELRERQGRIAVGDRFLDADEAAASAGEPPLDYAVKMRQLPSDRWLLKLLARGEVTEELIRKIGRRIADFHAEAESRAGEPGPGDLDTVRFNTRENFEQTEGFVGETLSRETHRALRAYTEAFIATREELFRKREREGRIRDCHGDLHLQQICVVDGLAFIDCIEFTERFRWSDVTADLAFLAMDLDHHRQEELAAALVQEYVARSGDRELPELLPFYQCYRAFVRGKVEGFRLAQMEEGDPEREAVRRQAGSYFDLARRYAAPKGPLLIVLTGLMGSGKSSIGRVLASGLEGGAPVRLLSSDETRKQLAGIDSLDRQFVPWEEGIYSPEFTRRTYEALHASAREVLAAGGIAILDASYADEERRRKVAALAREAAARFLLVETRASEESLLERLQRRHATGPAVSDGRVEILQQQIESYEEPDELPREQRIDVDTSEEREVVALRVLKTVFERLLADQPQP